MNNVLNNVLNNIMQVKKVHLNGVAGRDGSIKRGDCIISVNGIGLSGLSHKESQRVLKEAEGHVTLVLKRKVGRWTSRATTPLMSTMYSQRGSGENSWVESRTSPQHSPKNALYRRQHGSSEDESREGSQGHSPQQTRKRHRKESVGVEGEVLTFRNDRSTLPRKLKGAKVGIQLVELHKGPTGLGMQLQGDTDSATPIIVKEILRGGAAYKSGKIHKGDEILEVNGQSFEDLNYQEAVQTMKKLPQGKVSIILRNHKASHS